MHSKVWASEREKEVALHIKSILTARQTNVPNIHSQSTHSHTYACTVPHINHGMGRKRIDKLKLAFGVTRTQSDRSLLVLCLPLYIASYSWAYACRRRLCLCEWLTVSKRMSNCVCACVCMCLCSRSLQPLRACSVDCSLVVYLEQFESFLKKKAVK